MHNYSPIPPILYGTAWKEEHTERLVTEALHLGFEGIDTANQRRHYFEEGVGLGLQQFLKSSPKKREDLFLQSKFTSIHGQDARLPYDPSTSLANQVKQSFDSSLTHLKTDYLDSYVLHGPMYNQGIVEADLEIWQAMEALFREGKVRFLGISNVSVQQLEALCKIVSLKPNFVQNRCFTISNWDQDIRSFCKKHTIIYQGFSLLTANLLWLEKPYIKELADKYRKTIPQIIFRFARSLEMLPLTGTTNQQHMKDDLSIDDFILDPLEIRAIENLCMEASP
jgi:diketogulonate reductase-like aldo/keto reductase